jgi:hypothetical protein
VSPADSFGTPIGVGVGIGVGIELINPISAKLADRLATLSELREHGHNTIEQCLLLAVVVCGQRIAHRRTSSIAAHSSAEPRAISKYRRRSPLVALPLPSAMFSAMACDARLRCAQELILRVTLSFHMLAVAVGPVDRLDGHTVYVELLTTEWHRAFSLLIPIPIPVPIATPTPIALRRCLDSIV